MALSPNVPTVAPGELITAAHLNNVRANLDRLDTSKLSLTGGTITGNLIIAETVTVRIYRPGSPRPYLEFYDAAGAARYAVIVGADTGIEVVSDVGPVRFFPNGATVDPARIDVTNMLLGKQTSNLQAAGVEVAHQIGSIRTTMNAGSTNYYGNHIGPADVNGAMFAQFLRAGTAIGSITQTSTTGVAYNATSDKRLKSLTRPVDPDEAVAKVAAIQPVNFTWKSAPGDGEQTGFFAQDLHTVAPEAVTVGTGEPGDGPDPDTGEPGFVPWMVDPSKLVPTLVAAVQALTRRIEQLEGAAP